MALQTDDQQLENLIVSKIVELGCACAVDLAGAIGGGVKPEDLVVALSSLVKKGVLRIKIPGDDVREYTGWYQTVYELAR